MNKRQFVFKNWFVVVLYVFAFFSACGKKPDGQITITTKDAFDITGNSATSGGYVSSFGYTVSECGVCFSEQSYPSTSDVRTIEQVVEGEFSSTLSDLKSGTKYYVRAYAKTSSGIEYGDEVSFVTQGGYMVNVFVNTTAGGTVTGAGTYQNGQNCTVTATPKSGYSFTNWTENGVVVSTDATFNFTVASNRTLMANFEEHTGTWLYYDDSEVSLVWGYLDGGTLEWAVMFPSSVMEQYVGMDITTIGAVLGVVGTYNLKLYTGETVPTTQIYSGNSTVSETGWQTITLQTPVRVTAQNVWVSFTVTHGAGEHPAGSSVGSNNPNARWINWGSNGWCDAYLAGWSDEDLTWIIRAYVIDGDKNREIEISPSEIPSYPSAPTIASGSQSVGSRRRIANQ